MATNTDARGVLRGACSSCACDGYLRPESGAKCEGCGHPPGKHKNLSAPTVSTDGAAPQRSAPQSPPQFSVGPTCDHAGCSESQYFDLNTGIQSRYCKYHLHTVAASPFASLPSRLDGLTLNDSSSPPSSAPHPFTSLVAPADGSRYPAPPQVLPSHVQSPPPASLPQFSAPLPQFSAPLFASTSTPSLTSASIPMLTPQPPLIPPDQQCRLSGCHRPKFREPGPKGKTHDCCGRRHALEFARLNEQQVVSSDQKCKTAGCSRRKRAMPDGQGFFDFCSLTCRDSGHKAAPGIHPSQSMPGMGSGQGMCLLPGCDRPKYVDPANNRTHDFCGRTHAKIGQSGGSQCQIQRAGGQQLATVTTHFTSMWAKGSCPPITCAFVVTNTTLTQRFSNYRQTLSITTVEQYYHGTKLTCNLSQQNTLCSDTKCGICGICQSGLDRRCIGDNIAFQRFGHGFYLAPNSSKCHDYTQGNPSLQLRAMLLFDVAPGKKYRMQANNEKLTAPPNGFNSIHGVGGSSSVLNYDELVVYNPDSSLPRYIVVYQKDGINKRAT